MGQKIEPFSLPPLVLTDRHLCVILLSSFALRLCVVHIAISYRSVAAYLDSNSFRERSFGS